MTNADIAASIDAANAMNAAQTQAAITTQSQTLSDLTTPAPAPAPTPGLQSHANPSTFEGMDTPAAAVSQSHANQATMAATPGLAAPDPGHANPATMAATPGLAAPAPGHANPAAMESQPGLSAVTQGHANQATMGAQAGLGTVEQGHANEEAFESMDKTDEDQPALETTQQTFTAPKGGPIDKAMQDRNVQNIVTQATKGVTQQTTKEEAIARGSQARSALAKSGVPASVAKSALTTIATQIAAAKGYTKDTPLIGGMVQSEIDKGIALAMQGYNPVTGPVQGPPAPVGGLAPTTGAPAAPTDAPTAEPAADPNAQPSADIAGRSPTTIADVVDAMVDQQTISQQQANQLATNFGPNYGPQAPGLAEPGNITPSTHDLMSSNPLGPNQSFTTGPLSQAPGIHGTPTPGQQTPTTQTPTTQTTTTQSPTTSPAPGVPAPASPAATQAVTSAMQAAMSNPSVAAQIGQSAPEQVRAVADAFRVDPLTAAMMVLQGAERAGAVPGLGEAAPSQSPVSFSDLGRGGGATSASPNVDSMVQQVMGMQPGLGGQNQFSRGAAPGFAQGGLVQLAAGGLAKPVLSQSSMGSMGQTAHFGGMNLSRSAKGAGMPAINAKAVTSPGAHLINSTVPGRTDRIPMRARVGSFVIPADVVSGLGEGNTMAGAKMWGQLLSASVAGKAPAIKAGRAPSVSAGLRGGRMTGPGSRVPAPPRPIIAPPQKVPFENLPVRSQGLPHGFADGGYMGHNGGPPMDDMDDDTTPIVTAGGEMIVDPEVVMMMGDGDPDTGTQILRKSVDGIRKQMMEFHKKLPSPST